MTEKSDKPRSSIVTNLAKFGIATVLPFFIVFQTTSYILDQNPELKANNRQIITPFVKENISFLLNLWQGLK